MQNVWHDLLENKLLDIVFSFSALWVKSVLSEMQYFVGQEHGKNVHLKRLMVKQILEKENNIFLKYRRVGVFKNRNGQTYAVHIFE
jgi:hypothetical protein